MAIQTLDNPQGNPLGYLPQRANTKNLGLVQLATNAEAIAGTNSAKVLTPAADLAALQAFVSSALTSQIFTPVLGTDGTAPTTLTVTATGTYLRFTNQVQVTMTFTVTAFTIGPGSGNLTISGLPVAASAAHAEYDLFMSALTVGLSAGTINLRCKVASGATTGTLAGIVVAGTSSPIALTGLGVGSVIHIQGNYSI